MNKIWKVLIIVSILLLILNFAFTFLTYKKYETISNDLNNQKVQIDSQKTDIFKMKKEMENISSDYDPSDLEGRIDELESQSDEYEGRIEYLEKYSHWHN
jgi:peptidoglycan hydrolase CwlO-like protein